MKTPETDTKIIAMINDLSPEALCGLVCMSPYLQTRLRQMVVFEYNIGKVIEALILDAWETDE